MQPQIIPLATQTPNIFNGITVRYYEPKGEKLQLQEMPFEATQVGLVAGFCLQADIALLVHSLNNWVAKQEYGIKHFYSNNRPLAERLGYTIGKIRTLRDKLKQYTKRPELAGLTSSGIVEVLELVKPPQEHARAFMDYIRVSTIAEDFKATYYKPINLL